MWQDIPFRQCHLCEYIQEDCPEPFVNLEADEPVYLPPRDCPKKDIVKLGKRIPIVNGNA
jgi:hypothetical protein